MDEILERDVDMVIHSGDVFDTIRPATHVIVDFLKQTSRLYRANIPYLGIAGNHETPRLRSTTAALEYANILGGAYFAHGFEVERETEDAGGARVALSLVPHGAVLDRDVAVMPDPGADLNILVTHGTVPGLKVHGHELGNVDLPDHVLDGGFDYVALGHFHDFHRHNANSYYAGATERFSFAEVGFQTGFAILDFSGDGMEIEHVPLPSRSMVDLPRINAGEMDGAELTEEIRRKTEGADLDGAIARLKVVDAPVGIAGEVDRELLRDLRSRCLSFSLEVSSAESPAGEDGEASPAAFGPLEEELRSFVEAKRRRGELDEAFARETIERGVEYLRSAGDGERAQG